VPTAIQLTAPLGISIMVVLTFPVKHFYRPRHGLDLVLMEGFDVRFLALPDGFPLFLSDVFSRTFPHMHYTAWKGAA
jgi:hypothetical protein